MKIDSMGDHLLVESQETDAEEEAKKTEPPFRVESIVKERAESEKGQHTEQNKERLGHIIDFVAKARQKKMKMSAKKKARVIRSYEAIGAYEDNFIFKGRFHREA